MAVEASRREFLPRLGVQGLQQIGVGGAANIVRAIGDIQGNQVVHSESDGKAAQDAAALSFLSGSLHEAKKAADGIIEQRQEYGKAKGARAYAEGASYDDMKKRGMQDGWLRAKGMAAGAEIRDTVRSKVEAGEFNPEQAREYVREQLKGLTNVDAPMLEAVVPEATRGIVEADSIFRNKAQEELKTTVKADFSRALFALQKEYSPADPSVYQTKRAEWLASAKAAGLSGSELNALELKSLMDGAAAYKSSDPHKALQLLDLAEMSREDGTPGPAGSVPDGSQKLAMVRSEVLDHINAQEKQDAREARMELERTRTDAYALVLTDLSKANTPEDVDAAEAKYFGDTSPEQLINLYGVHAAELRQEFTKRKMEIKQGADISSKDEFDRLSIAVEEGNVSTEDVKSHPTLSPGSKAILVRRLSELGANKRRDTKDKRDASRAAEAVGLAQARGILRQDISADQRDFFIQKIAEGLSAVEENPNDPTGTAQKRSDSIHQTMREITGNPMKFMPEKSPPAVRGHVGMTIKEVRENPDALKDILESATTARGGIDIGVINSISDPNVRKEALWAMRKRKLQLESLKEDSYFNLLANTFKEVDLPHTLNSLGAEGSAAHDAWLEEEFRRKWGK